MMRIKKGKYIDYLIFLFSLYFIVATKSKVFLQDLEGPTDLKLIFDYGENDGLFITGCHEGNRNKNLDKSNNFTIFLVLNEINLIEIDLNKYEIIQDNILSSFFHKSKAEGKTKCFKIEYYKRSTNGSGTNLNFNISTQNYSILINNNENKNIQTIWHFTEKVITLKFRPKMDLIPEELHKNNHMAISFIGGKLKVFNYESKYIIYEYKTTYGNIICLEYSDNGKLLGLGTENDNVFIIDAQTGGLIFCLEGHKNFITSIYFDELEDDINIAESLHTTTSKSIVEKVQRDSELSYNYNSVSSVRKINEIACKQVTLDEISNLFLDDDTNTSNNFDFRNFKRTRTSVNEKNSVEDFRASSVFDIYTASLDGYLGVWRIEHFCDFEDPYTYVKSYPIHSNISSKDNPPQIIKLEQPHILRLTPQPNIKVENTSMVKLGKGPLNQVVILDNLIAMICKRNIHGSHCFLTIYHGKAEEQISNLTDNPITISKHTEIDSKVEKISNNTHTSGVSSTNFNDSKNLETVSKSNINGTMNSESINNSDNYGTPSKNSKKDKEYSSEKKNDIQSILIPHTFNSDSNKSNSNQKNHKKYNSQIMK